jgi:hypothetical protein
MRISVVSKYDPMMTARIVPDFHAFCEARFSCRELMRFVGIALDGSVAAQMASLAAYQSNHFLDSVLGCAASLNARHFPLTRVA